MIEKSPAFKDGGLIDITFDEADPPFTYSGNSFNNANDYGPTLNDKPNAANSVKSDAAGENINGKNVHYEPTGPNSTLGKDANGNELYPGPGYNGFLNRPPVCTATTPILVPANCVPNIVRGGSGTTPGARDRRGAANTSSTYVEDPSDPGRRHRSGRGRHGRHDRSRGAPAPSRPTRSSARSATPARSSRPRTPGSVINGSFQLVDSGRQPGDPDRCGQQPDVERRGRARVPGPRADAGPDVRR